MPALRRNQSQRGLLDGAPAKIKHSSSMDNVRDVPKKQLLTLFDQPALPPIPTQRAASRGVTSRLGLNHCCISTRGQFFTAPPKHQQQSNPQPWYEDTIFGELVEKTIRSKNSGCINDPVSQPVPQIERKLYEEPIPVTEAQNAVSCIQSKVNVCLDKYECLNQREGPLQEYRVNKLVHFLFDEDREVPLYQLIKKGMVPPVQKRRTEDDQ